MRQSRAIGTAGGLKWLRAVFIALHDTRIAANSPVPLGTMRFYAEDLPTLSDVTELDSVDSLTIFQVGRNTRCVGGSE